MVFVILINQSIFSAESNCTSTATTKTFWKSIIPGFAKNFCKCYSKQTYKIQTSQTGGLLFSYFPLQREILQ